MASDRPQESGPRHAGPEPGQRESPGEPGPRDAGAAEDALRRLEERLGRASDAAERLLAEAASQAAARAAALGTSAAARSGSGSGDAPAAKSEAGGSGEADSIGADGPGAGDSGPGGEAPKPPPAGWQIPRAQAGAGPGEDAELLVHVVQALRDLIPPELQRRLAEALRELLLAIRALIDWYLERVERRRAEPNEIQDIPIF